MAVRSVSTLESFLLVGVVGTCLRKLANPSLTSFTLFLSLSFLRRIEACSFFRHCGVRQRVRCPGAFGLELGELYSLLGDDDRGETGELTGEVTGESNGEPSDEGDGVGELSSDKSRSSRVYFCGCSVVSMESVEECLVSSICKADGHREDKADQEKMGRTVYRFFSRERRRSNTPLAQWLLSRLR